MVVYNARVATNEDPNKRQILILTPSKELLIKLDRLKQVYGRVSRERLITAAVDLLYSKHFK